MAEVQKKPVKIVETVLRDAHQSLIATRMTTEQMLPIVDKMDKVGYYAVECWGGATFDACLRFLKEDPWERLRKLRDGFKNTKLQMLFRGQNILGYNHYADDVVEYFVQKSIANGIDIIRIFDCLNDIRNLETAVKATKKEKATCTDRPVLHPGRCLYPGLLEGHRQERSRIWALIPSASRIWQDFLTPVCGSRAGNGSEGRQPSCRSTCIPTIPPVLLP